MGKIRKKDIAIIGFAFKLPGGDDPESFWYSLLSDRDAIRNAPPDRRKGSGPVYSETEELLAGFLEDANRFDAAYFNMSPRESAAMDLRQRLFLETAVAAADMAGYGGEKLWGSDTGVFAGASADTGGLWTAAQAGPMENATHHAPAMIANRVSHHMNLYGPSKTIDTLCSSTLSAIDEACRSLRRGETQTALAGGIHLIASPRHMALLRKMNLISASGRCRTFDEGADGFVPGEGVGVFLLKPLKAALRDGDCIWGVIKGTAVNHTGRAESPFMPDAGAVARVVGAALKDAGIAPATVTFIETNGTGTPLGDAVEFQGLRQAFQDTSPKRQFCGLGAVKTRIGNLEAASGVGALVKILLSMKHEQIPKNLHFKRINPLIQIAGSPFYLCNETVDWKRSRKPQRAGINACGIGGTNCHLVIEAPPEMPSADKNKSKTGPGLLCLSARTKEALKALCGNYLLRIEPDPDLNIRDLCATHNTGRTHFPCALSIVWETRAELMSALKEIVSSPEDQWQNLKNVNYSGNIRTRKPVGKKGVLAHLRNHYQKDGTPRRFWCQRPASIVFVSGGNDWGSSPERRKYENYLKAYGIMPEVTVYPGGGGPEPPPSDRPRLFIGLGVSKNEIKMDPSHGEFFISGPQHIENRADGVRLAAAVYAHGGAIDFESFYSETPFRKVPLPPYPFDHTAKPLPRVDDVRTPSEEPFSFLESLLDEIRSGQHPSDLENQMVQILTQTLVRIGGYAPSDIDPDRAFRDYGIDSIITTRLTGILETCLGFGIGPSVFSRYDTIGTLAAFLANGSLSAGRRQPIDSVPKDPVALVEAGKVHLEDVRRWFSDPETTRWLDPFFQKGLDAKAFGFFLSKRDKKTYAVIYRSTPVGICGLIDIDPRNRTAETWLVIGEGWARAAGVAAAAGTALCETAFGELDLKTLTGKVRIDNAPALSLMHYTGWESVGLLKDSLQQAGRFYNRFLFQITRSGFKRWRETHTEL